MERNVGVSTAGAVEKPVASLRDGPDQSNELLAPGILPLVELEFRLVAGAQVGAVRTFVEDARVAAEAALEELTVDGLDEQVQPVGLTVDGQPHVSGFRHHHARIGVHLVPQRLVHHRRILDHVVQRQVLESEDVCTFRDVDLQRGLAVERPLGPHLSLQVDLDVQRRLVLGVVADAQLAGHVLAGVRREGSNRCGVELEREIDDRVVVKGTTGKPRLRGGGAEHGNCERRRDASRAYDRRLHAVRTS